MQCLVFGLRFTELISSKLHALGLPSIFENFWNIHKTSLSFGKWYWTVLQQPLDDLQKSLKGLGISGRIQKCSRLMLINLQEASGDFGIIQKLPNTIVFCCLLLVVQHIHTFLLSSITWTRSLLMATLTGRSEFPKMFENTEDEGRSIWPRKKTLLFKPEKNH